MYVVVKALVSGIIIAAASEAARRSTLLGAIIISLPLTSILAIVWLYRDTGDSEQIISLSWSILWVIVPSLVFFVALPLGLRSGLGFLPSLLIACCVTAVAYAAGVAAARALGLSL